MLVDQVASSEQKAVWLCNFLAIFRYPNTQIALARALTDELGPLSGFVYTPPTPTMVASFAGWTEECSFIAFDGAVNNSLASGLINGYYGTSVISGSVGVAINEPLNDFLENMERNINSFPSRPVMIATGFSTGGAVAQIACGRRYPRASGLRWECITFGAPRPGGVTVQRLVDSVRNVRWMNDDDWVPLLPGSSTTLPSFTWTGGVPGARRLRNFVHAKGGLMLGNTGSISENEIPNVATIPSASAFAASLLQANTTDLFLTHHLDEYRRRILAAIARQPEYEIREHRTSPREVPHPVSRTAMVAAERRTASVIFDLGEQQNSVPVIIPRQRLFKAKRFGRVWWVYFGDKAVCIGPRKRRAQGIAAAGNDFIRRLQRQVQVDSATLADQWVNYLRAASDPSAGFLPQLNAVSQP